MKKEPKRKKEPIDKWVTCFNLMHFLMKMHNSLSTCITLDTLKYLPYQRGGYLNPLEKKYCLGIANFRLCKTKQTIMCDIVDKLKRLDILLFLQHFLMY